MSAGLAGTGIVGGSLIGDPWAGLTIAADVAAVGVSAGQQGNAIFASM